MPRSEPLPSWSGQDAYIVGGGLSLRDFDFTRLNGRNVIACNQAALELGYPRCQILTFGDLKFWAKFKLETREVDQFGGWVVTNYWVMNPPAWLKMYQRQEEGLATPDSGRLGWNYNTGALSINLALNMGAQRVYLLGFDMRRTNERSHWHDRAIEKSTAEHYARFHTGFDCVARSLSAYPGRQVFNVTDGFSQLKSFPRVTIREAFEVFG